MNDIVVNLDRAFAICGSSLYGENFSYSNALPSHESNHMNPYPLHLEGFYTRPKSIPLSYWDINTDSRDIQIYQEHTDSYDNFSCGTISDLDISDY